MVRTALAFIVVFMMVLWTLHAPAASTACDPQSQAQLYAIAECDGFQSPLDCMALHAFTERSVQKAAGGETNSAFAQRLKFTALFEMQIREGFKQLGREASPLRWLIIRDRLATSMKEAPAGLLPVLQNYARRFDDYAELMVTRSLGQLPAGLSASPLPSLPKGGLVDYLNLLREMQRRKNLHALRTLSELAKISSPLQISFHSALVASQNSKLARPDLALKTIREDLNEFIRQEKGFTPRQAYPWLSEWINSRPSPMLSFESDPAGERRTVAAVAMATAGSYASEEATRQCLSRLLKKERIKLTSEEFDFLSRHLSMAGPVHRCHLNLEREQLISLLRRSPSRMMCETLQVLNREKLEKLKAFTPRLKTLRCETSQLTARIFVEDTEFSVEVRPGQDRLYVSAPFNSSPGESALFQCQVNRSGDRLKWCDKLDSSSLSEKNPHLQSANSILLTPRYAWRMKTSCPKAALDGPGSRDHVRRQICHAGKVLQAFNYLLAPTLGPCFGERMNLNST